MLAVFDDLRRELNEKARRVTDEAFEHAKSRSYAAVQQATRDIERVHTVTESYRTLGYHKSEGWNGFYIGKYRNETAYVRALARSMKRPYVRVLMYGWRAVLSVPRQKRFGRLWVKALLATGGVTEFGYGQATLGEWLLTLTMGKTRVTITVQPAPGIRDGSNLIPRDCPLFAEAFAMLNNDDAIRAILRVPPR